MKPFLIHSDRNEGKVLHFLITNQNSKIPSHSGTLHDQKLQSAALQGNTKSSSSLACQWVILLLHRFPNVYSLSDYIFKSHVNIVLRTYTHTSSNSPRTNENYCRWAVLGSVNTNWGSFCITYFLSVWLPQMPKFLSLSGIGAAVTWMFCMKKQINLKVFIYFTLHSLWKKYFYFQGRFSSCVEYFQ